MHTSRRSVLVAIAAILVVAGGGSAADALLTDSESVVGVAATAASFSGTVYYLHNNPTPPTGNTASQVNLAMNTTTPAAAILHNYDTDLDASPGRRLRQGGSGATETDLPQYQNWRGPAAGVLGQSISGTVTVELWAAVDAFAGGTAGELTIFLRDVLVLTGTTSEIASGSVASVDWQGATSGWKKAVISVGVSYTLLLGHALELKVIAGPSAAADMLLAYDTAVYRSRVRLP